MTHTTRKHPLRVLSAFILLTALLCACALARADTEGTTASRAEAFLNAWQRNDWSFMADQCTLTWREQTEEPGQSMYSILRLRRLLDYRVMVIVDTGAGERMAVIGAAVTYGGRPDEAPVDSLILIWLKKEAGAWYVDPERLVCYPAADGSAEQAFKPDADTLLYYNPEGGRYYHLDPRCPSIANKYLPLAGVLTYGQLGDGAFRSLQPCPFCIIPEGQ